MNVWEIIVKYLKDNGYDGLCGYECGCEIKDLWPFDCSDFGKCEPGYKVPCGGDGESYCDGDCFWHMSPTKEKKGDQHEQT